MASTASLLPTRIASWNGVHPFSSGDANDDGLTLAIRCKAPTSPLRAAPAASNPAQGPQDLAKKHLCLTCHGVENKVVGPALRDIAKKHGARPDAVDYLKQKIVNGGAGQWGPIPMPAQTLPSADAAAIAKWLADGAK